MTASGAAGAARLLGNGKPQHLQDVLVTSQWPGDRRPSIVDLLDEREQPLRTEGKRSEDRHGGAQPLFARQLERQRRDEHQARRLDDVPRRRPDERVAGMGLADPPVRCRELLDELRLRSVDDDVANAADAFLHDPDPLSEVPIECPRIRVQRAAREALSRGGRTRR